MQPDLGWTKSPIATHHIQSHTHIIRTFLISDRTAALSEMSCRLMLARIEPGPNGADLRTFECPNCEHVPQTLVEDPMKSGNAGWINSALKSPN